MHANRDEKARSPQEPPDPESGQPGGGRGRVDEVGRTGVYPASGPYPPGKAEIRTPESFVHGQRDAEGYQEEGGSEPIMFGKDTVIGGATPPPGGKPAGTEPPPRKSP